MTWWLLSGNMFNKEYWWSEGKASQNSHSSIFYAKICVSLCQNMHSMLCVGASMCVPICVSELAGQRAIVQQRPQGLLPPQTRHNKGQLNAAALPAEEPTASHTSTNRQICLKPKGRSNKSQPTESNPLRLSSADSNQKVTGSPHHSLSALSQD